MATHACSTPPPDDSGHTARVTPLSQRLADLATDGPIVVGHRGTASTHPENTLPSFSAAVTLGAGMVEFDVRQTADGELVCMHDETIDRTTNGSQLFGRDRIAVRSLTLEQVRQLDAGTWRGPEHSGAAVPTLAEALDAILAGSVPMVEHKDGDAEAYVKLIRELGLRDEILLQSFDWEWLDLVRQLDSGLTLGALGEGRLTMERLASIERLGVSMVHWKHSDLTIDDVETLHDRGYLVCTFTIANDLELIGAARAELDAVTTGVPARLVELQRRGLARR